MLLLVYIEIWMFAGHVMTQTCVQFKQKSAIYKDKRLDNYQISHLLNFSLDKCGLECLLLTMCKSFNHRIANGICELNSANLDELTPSSLTNMTNFIYHDIRDWPAELAGTCASKPCAENQRCIQSTPYTCLDIDCGTPQNYQVSNPPLVVKITPASHGTSLGSKAHYYCADNRFSIYFYINNSIPFINSTIRNCNSDFTWSPLNTLCHSKLVDCEDVKRCNPNYGDGHYWIYKDEKIYQRVKVYCMDMATTPRTYITLPSEGNIAVHTGYGTASTKISVYSKVRIDRDFIIDGNDYTFGTKQGPQQEDVPFGWGGSCESVVNGEAAYGYFKINTKGTGLRVSPMVTGAASYTTVTNFTNTGTEVSGYCWGGVCGWCYTSTLELVYDFISKQVVDETDTVHPADCVF